MKRVPLIAVLAVCLCSLSLTAAQDKDTSRLNSDQAKHPPLGPHCVPALAGAAALDKDAYRLDSELAARIAVNVERTIKAKEPKWRLQEGRSLGHIFHPIVEVLRRQAAKSGDLRLWIPRRGLSEADQQGVIQCRAFARAGGLRGRSGLYIVPLLHLGRRQEGAAGGDGAGPRSGDDNH